MTDGNVQDFLISDGFIFEKRIYNKDIKEKTKRIGEEITKYYKDNNINDNINVLTILKGAKPFSELLNNYLKFNKTNFDFRAKSYKGTTRGKLKLEKPDFEIEGKNFLIVEDIVDSGNTIKAVKECLYEKGAKDIKIVSLFKTNLCPEELKPNWFCFINDLFIIGFGLDLNDKYRDLEDIWFLKNKKVD